MKDFINEHVKCFLRNSTVIEGIVISWAVNEIQLQSLDQQSILIIHNPAQDIVLTKVLLADVADEPAEILPDKPHRGDPPVATLEEAFELLTVEEPEEQVDPMALQAKSTAELKVQLAIQERNIVAKKLKNHHFTEVPRKTTYGYPGFFKKSRAK
jgi:hypothetical protein